MDNDEPTREQLKSAFAYALELNLKKLYSDNVSFFLNVVDDNDESGKKAIDYFSNTTREVAMDWMRESINIFDDNKEIPDSDYREQ